MIAFILVLGSLQLAGARAPGVSRLELADTVSTPAAPADSVASADSVHRRPRAIEFSDAYYTRLTIHRIGSYTMLPLFAGEYVIGQRLLTGTYPPRWMKPAHGVIAGGLGVLFTVNTITGAWNLWDARHNDEGRTRRYLHTGLMLASDAGFAWAGAIGGESNNSLSAAHRHRNVAIGSMALSTAGTAMMWFWRD